MKRLLALFILLALCLSLLGCTEDPAASIQTSSIYPAWPYYSSLDTLTAAASHIYEGKVTRIFYDVLDTRTGSSVSGQNAPDTRYLALYTVYEIEVSHSLKGECEQTMRLCVIGGTKTPATFHTQKSMLEASGIYHTSTGIPVASDVQTPVLGESYLFLTLDLGGAYQYIVSGNQYLYSTNNDKNTGFSYHDVKTYLQNQLSSQ